MRVKFILPALIACSPATPVANLQPNVVAFDASTITAAISPATWQLDASPRWSPSARMAQDNGEMLLVGAGGERWLKHADQSLEGATSILPEGISGVQKGADGFRFVTRTGAVYVSSTPLGPLTKVSPGQKDAHAVAVSMASILVANASGDLVRSVDEGKSFAKADLPGNAGIAVDVVAVGHGALALTAPQRIYYSNDDGASWKLAKSPGGGARSLEVRDDALMLVGAQTDYKLDSSTGAFTEQKVIASSDSQDAATRRIRLIEGDVVAEIDHSTGAWRFGAASLGTRVTLHDIPELAACTSVYGDMRAGTVVLACNTIDADGGQAPVFKLYRTTDMGKTFKLDGSMAGGVPAPDDVAIAVGPSGWLYIGARCENSASTACQPARMRTSGSAPWTDLPLDTVHAAFAFGKTAAFSVGSDNQAAGIYRWQYGASTPERIAAFDLRLVSRSAIGVDDDGVYGIFGFAKAFQWQEGKGVTLSELPAFFSDCAFAGKRGFAVDGYHAFETSDGGKTWGLVGLPAFFRQIDGCSATGCGTDRGYRFGWDFASKTVATTIERKKGVSAKPLHCTAKDAWVALGGGFLPGIHHVDHGSVRWALPVSDGAGKLSVLSNKRGDPVTKTSSVMLLGSAPTAPQTAAKTVPYIQRNGIVAVRYAYNTNKDKTGVLRNALNPVDATIAWLRYGTAKPVTASVAKVNPFPVKRDAMDSSLLTLLADSSYAETSLPEVVFLGPRGVYFHPPLDDEGFIDPPTPLYLLRDDGKIDKSRYPHVDDDDAALFVTKLRDTPAIISYSGSGDYRVTLSGRTTRWNPLPSAVFGSYEAITVVESGGALAFAATIQGNVRDSTTRAWLIPFTDDAELGTPSTLPTQKTIGDEPKACDAGALVDQKLVSFPAPMLIGSRHPVLVDSDGLMLTFATEEYAIRASPSGPTSCTAAMTAKYMPANLMDKTPVSYTAIVFPDDLAHSVYFRADTHRYPAQISARAMSCVYQDGPVPDNLKGTTGFDEGEGANFFVWR